MTVFRKLEYWFFEGSSGVKISNFAKRQCVRV
jgi:hypothetical protein